MRSENGWTVVTAMMVTAVMLALGLATFSFVGGQQSQSGDQRIGESSFNLSEGVLSSQAFALSSHWPGTPPAAYPPACVAGGPVDERCPDTDLLGDSYDEADYGSDTSWTSQVRDDAPPPSVGPGASCPSTTGVVTAADPFYADSVRCNPRWDANRNGELWVRSEAVVRGQPRAMVARVEVEQVTEQFPRNLATTGKLATSNNGNKVMIDRQGGQAVAAPISVRCPQSDGAACVNQGNKGPGTQISPSGGIQYGYPGATAPSPGALDRLRTKAKSLGTYVAGPACPGTLANTASRIVFIEQTPSTGCKYTGSGDFYSPTAPGLLVVARGKLLLGGNTTFYGLIYAANLQGSTEANVVEMGGNAQVFGAIAVDGKGGVTVAPSGGQKEGNLVWDPRVFDDPITLTSYGDVGVIKNTFRELDQ